jgi:hypothetical protein
MSLSLIEFLYLFVESFQKIDLVISMFFNHRIQDIKAFYSYINYREAFRLGPSVH